MEIDRVLALCGALLAFPLLLLTYSKSLPMGLPIVLLTSSVAYWIFRDRFVESSQVIALGSREALFPSLLTVAFVVCYCQSILILFRSTYHRPLEYFLVMGLLSALIAFEIGVSNYERRGSASTLTLSKIMLVAMNLQIGSYVLFPLFSFGIDSAFHDSLTRSMLQTGQIPPGTSYTAFPGFHIAGTALSLITALPSLKATLYLSCGLLGIISLALICKLATVYLGTRWGLFAGLLTSSTTWLVELRTEMTPQLLGLAMFLYLTYLLIGRPHKRSSAVAVLVIVASLTITHTLSSLISLISLAALIFGRAVVATKGAKQSRLVLSCFVLTASYWVYGSTFSDFVIRNLLATIGRASLLSFPLHFLSWWESDLAWMGTYAIYCLAAFGSLWYLRARGRTSQRVSLVFMLLAILLISYTFLIFLSSWSIVPDRWYAFALALAVIPASWTTASLARNWKEPLKGLYVFALVFVVTFFSITSPYANDDSPLLARNVTRESFTESELRAASTLNSIHKGVINTDVLYGGVVFNWTLNDRHLTDKELILIDVDMLAAEKAIHGLVIIRTTGLTSPVRFLTGGTYAGGAYSPYFYMLDTYSPDFIETQISRGNVVCNSQSVVAILRLE